MLPIRRGFGGIVGKVINKTGIVCVVFTTH